MTERDPAADKPLTMPFSNPAADLGWNRPLQPKWKASPRVHWPYADLGRAILAAAALVGLATTLAIVPLMYAIREHDWASVWVYIGMGIMVAQAGALSFGLVFGRGHWNYRMGLFWLVAILLVAIWATGYVISEWSTMGQFHPRMVQDIYRVMFSLPLLAIVIQLPLWGLKLFAGWSLVRPAETGPHHSERPLSISDYLLGMAVVAASLALTRLAPHSNPQEFWAGWSVAAASVAFLSLIGIPPAMLFVFRWPGGLAGQGAMAGYALFVAMAALMAFWAIEASLRVRLGGPSAWQLFGFFLILESFALGLTTVMLAARLQGYRLALGKSNGSKTSGSP
jgi:hypothetical protein